MPPFILTFFITTIHIYLNESLGASFVVPPKVKLVVICVLLTCCVPKLPYVLAHNILLKNDLVEHIWHMLGNISHNYSW
jgi:hypothetical protein